jgi:muramoyltetrapeptide carboxypeptidase
MKRLKPPALRKGDVIGICAPASPPLRDGDLGRGIAYLEGLGYRIELSRNLLRKNGYLAGTDRQRADDLNIFFRDPRVRAIIALRGGYGSMRILPMIDYAAARKHPKIFVGYSDLTVLQLALWRKCGLVTFAGPMVAGEMSRGLSGYAEELFWRMVSDRRPVGKLRTRMSSMEGGKARGTLLGGNLTMVSHLVGTGYFPPTRNCLLFFEEIGEQPYRVDRMLHHLKLSGALRGVGGVILGQFTDCAPQAGKPSLTVERVMEGVFGDLAVPVVKGLRHGHVAGSLTLPVGLPAILDAGKNPGIRFSEAAVS